MNRAGLIHQKMGFRVPGIISCYLAICLLACVSCGNDNPTKGNPHVVSALHHQEDVVSKTNGYLVATQAGPVFVSVAHGIFGTSFVTVNGTRYDNTLVWGGADIGIAWRDGDAVEIVESVRKYFESPRSVAVGDALYVPGNNGKWLELTVYATMKLFPLGYVYVTSGIVHPGQSGTPVFARGDDGVIDSSVPVAFVAAMSAGGFPQRSGLKHHYIFLVSAENILDDPGRYDASITRRLVKTEYEIRDLQVFDDLIRGAVGNELVSLYAGKAILLRLFKRFHMAAYFFRQALELDPDNVFLLGEYSLAAAFDKRPLDALRALTIANGIAPDNPWAVYTESLKQYYQEVYGEVYEEPGE